ncbi:MAG: hypothetical protein R3Y43_07140 [Alphaproteobacteria bacterium]
MHNIHATAIKLKGKGVLILGKSGSGKSDVALRAIINHRAKLIADDRVNYENGIAYAVDSLKGLLEVRGVGIIKLPYIKKQKIDLVVELSTDIERMPEPEFYENIRKIKINPFEISAIEKIIIALDYS